MRFALFSIDGDMVVYVCAGKKSHRKSVAVLEIFPPLWVSQDRNRAKKRKKGKEEFQPKNPGLILFVKYTCIPLRANADIEKNCRNATVV